MNDKKKILAISDHPLSPSGVGTQTRYFIESLLETGRYRFVSFGGAVKHRDYNPVKTDKWGDDWIIYPVDNYGTQEMIRSAIRTEKPDMLWFMTDPRFYTWLWQIDNEIRGLLPMVYYHVWDNYPYPMFNKPYYDSNDVILAISKVTHDIVQTVSPDVESIYLPHSVDSSIYKPLPEGEITKFRQGHFPDEKNPDRMIFFWNNRNAKRKQSGTLIVWFKEFLDRIGHENACLIMHTDPKDPFGQDLRAILKDQEVEEGQILLSTDKVDPQLLAYMYNMADCTLNISDAEGFGLSTFESLSCGTPIIVNMTGGLQEQVTDGENWFGIGLEPSSKACIGSQDVPYIYEDRLNKEEFIDALTKIYNMSKEERNALGEAGRQHVLKNYNYEDLKRRWVEIIDDICEKHGAWETRKNYKSWKLIEVAA